MRDDDPYLTPPVVSSSSSSSSLGRLLIYDALKMTFREVELEKNPDSAPITSLTDSTYTCPDRPKGLEDEEVVRIGGVGGVVV